LFIILIGQAKVYGADADGREVVFNTQGAGAVPTSCAVVLLLGATVADASLRASPG
jgi:CRP-like cAMP-binding protein